LIVEFSWYKRWALIVGSLNHWFHLVLNHSEREPWWIQMSRVCHVNRGLLNHYCCSVLLALLLVDALPSWRIVAEENLPN
jgi:hypothetical protein